MDRVRSFLKFAGKGEQPVIAAFAVSPESAATLVAELQRQAPGIPVWLFCSKTPFPQTTAACEQVMVSDDSLALLVEAQKALWPYRVAFAGTAWTGEHLRWPVKLAPFLVPPFRTLILNRSGGLYIARPGRIAEHARRNLRDTMHSGWHRTKDLHRGAWLWLFAAVAQRFSWLSRYAFARAHGTQRLPVDVEPASSDGVAVFRYAHRQWNAVELASAIHDSSNRWLLFLESGADVDPAPWLPLFDDPNTFAVSRQIAFRDWKPSLFATAPFRQLQPGEVSRTLAPVSNAILVDRAKLVAVGVPKTVVPGSAWLLWFWKAASAGWTSYSIGGPDPLEEQPDWPYEEAEFVSRVLSDPFLRALGPGDEALSRGNIASMPALSRRSEGLQVLVVSPYLPYPLSHGGAVRIYNLCRALKGRVRLILACFREKTDHVHYDKLHDVFDEVYVVDRDERAAKDPGLPAQVREHRSAAMSALIGRVCATRNIDLVQMEFTHLAGFRYAAAKTPAILVEHDLTFTLYRQFGQQAEYQRWLAFEQSAFQVYDGVWVMSRQDREEAIANGSAPERTFEVANGVDLDRFTPADDLADPPEIFYIGSFRHKPNVLGFERLAHEVMPLVWREMPQARLRVVAGTDPEKYWQGRPDKRIVMHGFVEDVRPLYAKAHAVAVPLLVSAGTNIKVMEAMACGKAIVSTPAGVNGLELTDGHDILIRNDSAALAAALISVLSKPELRRDLGTRARATVEARFSWTAIADQAYESYLALLKERG